MNKRNIRYKQVSDTVKELLKDPEILNRIYSEVRRASEESARDALRVTAIDRMKAVKVSCFKKTERLLYNYQALEQHLASETEYVGMVFRDTSGSVVRYHKNPVDQVEPEQLIQDRMDSYARSKGDFDRLTAAIQSVSDSKWFPALDLKYLRGADRNLTYREITDVLVREFGFSETLSEKTVSRNCNRLVSEIAVYLFGTDAV